MESLPKKQQDDTVQRFGHFRGSLQRQSPDYKYHYMLKGKYIKQKKQRFDDLTFAMSLFCVKKSRKLRFLDEETFLNFILK